VEGVLSGTLAYETPPTRPGRSTVNGTALALVALALVVGSAVLWFRKAFALRLPENRGAFIGAWALGALLAAGALAAGTGALGTTAAIVALVASAFFLFTVAISRQIVAIDAIHVGSQLPDAGALDDSGAHFSLRSLAGKPTLIKFFRGHW